jgi:DNA (cytosine-5)-methyltransferase 1
MSLTVIDLFCGAGGLTAGIEAAGMKIVAAIDNNKKACLTHAQNFGATTTLCARLDELSPEDFAVNAGRSVGSVDLVVGGPPCQTFSTIGLAKIRSLKEEAEERSDIRNYLFNSFFDFVQYYQPKAFIMENVPALRAKYQGKLFQRLQERVRELGYSFSSRVLNAADYGVPQHRNRLFIVGFRKGPEFVFPNPTHGDAVTGASSPHVTVEDAISDLPIVSDGSRHHHLPYHSSARSEFQKKVRSLNGTVGNNICRMSNDRAKKIFTYMKQGDRYMDLLPEVRQILPFREDIFHDRLKRLRLDQPSWTVLAHIGMDGYMYIHPTEQRTLSVREAARLQGFSDSFEFIGNMREQYVQVGNAVPPMLAAAVAGKVRSDLECLG